MGSGDIITSTDTATIQASLEAAYQRYVAETGRDDGITTNELCKLMHWGKQRVLLAIDVLRAQKTVTLVFVERENRIGRMSQVPAWKFR